MDSKHIIVSGTSDETKKVEQLMGTGLRANHCYSLQSVHKAIIRGQNTKLVKLRNPWGHDAWNGASQYQTGDLMSKLGEC